MEPEPILLSIIVNPIGFSFLIGLFILIILLIISALISGSEVAFFSLTPTSIDTIKRSKTKSGKIILQLLKKPEHLLATILIANNFVNVGIVILSTYVTNLIFDFSQNPSLGFTFQVIIITFILLLFGEILPKIYAKQYSIKFCEYMSLPIFTLDKIFHPISLLLANTTEVVNKRLAKKRSNISIKDLSVALDLTSEEDSGNKKILKGIVEFGSIQVNEIMKARVDVVSIDIKSTFNKVKSVIIDSGFSRIPIMDGDIDNIIGVLYIKDLLPYLSKNEDINWQTIIREPYFVPETKKIDGLLEEFQNLKIHMAIIVDEYGGTSGIVTLEDVLEEIIGDINDELDDLREDYTIISDNEYLFEAKFLLNDFYKLFELEFDYFDEIKGEADTLAGLILEFKGELPEKGDKLSFGKFMFRVESVDNRRIKQIFLTIND